MNTVTLDGAKLKAIAHKTHTATVTATSLYLRERQRHSSDITRTRSELARQGERIVEADFMQFWKDLQAASVGSIIYGRKGKPDRFDWHYSLKAVAQSCIDGSNVSASNKLKVLSIVEPLKTSDAIKVQSESKASTEIPKAVNNSGRLVYVPLRPNFDVEINVPSNLTKVEAEFLAKALIRAAL